MRAELVNLNHCAVPFLSRAAVNLSWYDSTLYIHPDNDVILSTNPNIYTYNYILYDDIISTEWNDIPEPVHNELSEEDDQCKTFSNFTFTKYDNEELRGLIQVVPI